LSTVRSGVRRAAFRLATSDWLERTVIAVKPLRRFAYRRATRYVAGLDESAALETVGTLGSHGLKASVDIFGENVYDAEQAEAATDRYVALARLIADYPGTYLSVDCSHLAVDSDPAGCRDRVERIARALPAGAWLQINAEESFRTDAILDIAHATASQGLPAMATIQANLRRSPEDVEKLAAAEVPVRLCKGAYAEDATVAHQWGAPTDAAFVALAERLIALGAEHSLATQDPAILKRLLRNGKPATIEFVLGVRPDHARRLAHDGHTVRIWVPFGWRWFRCYARRVAESIGA
jgi:proline dehydrogenase